ncbi:MAG TPA: hypothetical protein VHP11_05775 [Tepidisphaeraceae bacterium]|nr:hypothetical protein [Tepidisphaeraceae bacterium]
MHLDIRIPIGLLFSIFGLLLVVYGLFSSRTIYQRSLGVNVNLIWGAVLLAFGLLLLLLASRARRQRRVPGIRMSK